jgi:hypothetical protein
MLALGLKVLEHVNMLEKNNIMLSYDLTLFILIPLAGPGKQILSAAGT